jgi:excinuclease UvrABC ATPase subunit
VHLFSFNNPYGACPVCEGYGNIIGIDELVVPNTTLSVFENAIFPWRESMSWFRDELVNKATTNLIPTTSLIFNYLRIKRINLDWKQLFSRFE